MKSEEYRQSFVILQDNVTGDEAVVKELQNFVKQDVAPYKYPRAIEFVDDLPKTNSGKIRRIELREAEKKNIYKSMLIHLKASAYHTDNNNDGRLFCVCSVISK